MAVEYFRDNKDWIGCYKGDSDLATPESVGHPAKASWGLAFRIVEHLEELGLLRPGDCVLDPMAGTGRFLLAACAKGYKAVGVELEEKFVGFLNNNKSYAEKRLGHPIDLTILQGDSRRLSDILRERGLIMVSSPPYIECGEPHSVDSTTAGIGRSDGKARGERMAKAFNILQAEGQIGNLPEGKIIVSSPPYENSEMSKVSEGIRNTHLNRSMFTGEGYGNTSNQIGQEHGESYWSAMKIIYAESLKVADVMVLVTKDPTRNKAIHPLGQMTADLITSIGWRIVDWHRAILYDTLEQGDLFGGTKKLYKGRVSFFKLLSLRKGSPAADHEDIIFAVNPNGRRSGICEISSPPYISGGHHTDVMAAGGGQEQGKEPQFKEGYGQSPGQIGNMPEGRVIISSPPYGDVMARESHSNGVGGLDGNGRPVYGNHPQNIGNLKE